jgi:hypothetical protein
MRHGYADKKVFQWLRVVKDEKDTKAMTKNILPDKE